jgi:type II secretory pathway predicted ATPase ExeA
MYESFFRFTTRPFVAAPIVASYFASESAESARQTLIRTIDRAEGPGLIVGAAGVGKTLLCRMLVKRFQETYRVAMLSSTRILTRKALLQNILFELGLAYQGMEEGELRLSLLDHLQPSEECPHGMLLIIDEAHALPLRLLEEVRMITNLVRDGQPRVRLVLAGGAKLEEKFANPKLESFNQRVAARCYLDSFGRDDTIDYVQSQIATAGGKAKNIFDDGALRAVYQATDGIPRLVNQICDHALVMAFAGGRQQIDAAGIEEAWADLQQLPGPWQDVPTTEASASTIEFGELDGEPNAFEFGAAEVVEFDGSASESPVVEVADEDVVVAEDAVAEDAAIEETIIDTVNAIQELESVLCLDSEPYDSTQEAVPVEDAEISEPFQVVASHPFGDGFDEEEVVIDQAIIQSVEIFANRTRVVSPEGRELTAAMKPELTEAPVPEVPVPEVPVLEVSAPEVSVHEESMTVESDIVESVDETESVEPVVAPIAEPDVEPIVSETELPALQEDRYSQVATATQMFEYTAFEPNEVADLALETLCDVNVVLDELETELQLQEEATVKLPEESTSIEHESDPDDREIIIVEGEDIAIASNEPEGSVVRVEYQTLFSQLRHG